MVFLLPYLVQKPSLAGFFADLGLQWRKGYSGLLKGRSCRGIRGNGSKNLGCLDRLVKGQKWRINLYWTRSAVSIVDKDHYLIIWAEDSVICQSKPWTLLTLQLTWHSAVLLEFGWLQKTRFQKKMLFLSSSYVDDIWIQHKHKLLQFFRCFTWRRVMS